MNERAKTNLRQVAPSALLVQVVSSTLSALLVAVLLGLAGLLTLPGKVETLASDARDIKEELRGMNVRLGAVETRLGIVETQQKLDREMATTLLETVLGESRASRSPVFDANAADDESA